MPNDFDFDVAAARTLNKSSKKPFGNNKSEQSTSCCYGFLFHRYLTITITIASDITITINITMKITITTQITKTTTITIPITYR